MKYQLFKGIQDFFKQLLEQLAKFGKAAGYAINH